VKNCPDTKRQTLHCRPIPTSRGANGNPLHFPMRLGGQSPRTRENASTMVESKVVIRSIPACLGKPLLSGQFVRFAPAAFCEIASLLRCYRRDSTLEQFVKDSSKPRAVNARVNADDILRIDDRWTCRRREGITQIAPLLPVCIRGSNRLLLHWLS